MFGNYPRVFVEPVESTDELGRNGKMTFPHFPTTDKTPAHTSPFLSHPLHQPYHRHPSPSHRIHQGPTLLPKHDDRVCVFGPSHAYPRRVFSPRLSRGSLAQRGTREPPSQHGEFCLFVFPRCTSALLLVVVYPCGFVDM